MRKIKFNAWIPELKIMLENITLYGNKQMGIESDKFEKSLPDGYTLYGDEIGGVEARYPLVYQVTESWACNYTGITSLAVQPIDLWASGDIIELKVNEGDVHYASAVIGKGYVESSPEW